MQHRRILAIHDLSCVGRCSLTTALPIISSVGVECSALPTAVLSTHTGGFEGYTYRDLTEDIEPIVAHWKSLDLKFDGIYTGFLGKEQVPLIIKAIDDLSDEKTTVYVDPVFGDEGKLYPTFDDSFPAEMRRLCEKADVLMPNMTELSAILGIEYVPGPYSREYVLGILDKAAVLGVEKIVITGVSYEFNSVGAVWKDYGTGETGECMRRKVSGYYHGTGDVFGAGLVGAMERDVPLGRAVEAAVDLTVGGIVKTANEEADLRYGVNFEMCLNDYIIAVEGGMTGLQLIPVTSDADIQAITAVGREMWKSLHGSKPGMMDSEEEIRDNMSRGYTYMMVPKGDDIIGYIGYHEDGRTFLMTGLRILEKERGQGYEEIVMDYMRSAARHMGYSKLTMHVNVHSKSAMALARDMGFMAMDEARHTLPDGRVVKANVMELVL